MKHILVQDNDDTTIYDVDNEQYITRILYSTIDSHWSPSLQGEIAAQLEDTGNGYKLYLDLDIDNPISINYSNFEKLKVLLKLHKDELTYRALKECEL